MRSLVIAIGLVAAGGLVVAPTTAGAANECVVEDGVAILAGVPGDAERICTFQAATNRIVWTAAVVSDWSLTAGGTTVFQSNVGGRYPSQAGREAGTLSVPTGATVQMVISGGCTLGCSSYGVLIAGPAA